MFRRGDLVLDKPDYRYDYQVYLLIEQKSSNMWWVRNLGSLQQRSGWNKRNVMELGLSPHSCLKLSSENLSEEKQKVYQEFKTNYLDKDLV